MHFADPSTPPTADSAVNPVNLSSAVLFAGAAAVVSLSAGCETDASDPTMDGVEGQFQTTPGDIEDFDPNELSADLTTADGAVEDETMGDSRLGDPEPETPGATEYDSMPLVPGDAGSRD